jgi:geranylgeranyl pyrophosphate synthase
MRSFINEWRPIIEREIRRSLHTDLEHGPLRVPLSYVVLTGGKRLRPLLSLAICNLVGGVPSDALALSLGIEMIHVSSLLLDDLPCMDDDDERRGLPAVHVAFDEATAILISMLLFNEGHRLLARDLKPSDAHWYSEVCDLIGGAGMIGGQYIDLKLAGSKDFVDGAERRRKHLRKTSALIEASVLVGAVCAGARVETVETLRAFGLRLGETYQLVDDAIDGERSGHGLSDSVLTSAKSQVRADLVHLSQEFGTAVSFEVAADLVGSMIERSA